MRPSIVLVLLSSAACGRFLHRSEPDAGESFVQPSTATTATTATTLASSEPEEEEPLAVADAGSTCPMPIHPNYCRFNCRSFRQRALRLHARRIQNPTRAGTGKCDAYSVFAEDDATGGIVEYYGSSDELVGVEDTHRKPCGTFGAIPKCKLDIQWGPPHLLPDVRK